MLEIEAPISHSLLSRRILNAWGISRLGVRLNQYLDSIYSLLELEYTTQNETKFYWNKNQEPKKYDVYRVPGDDDARRDANDLAKEEVSCGIIEVLTNQISLPEEDLIRETAKVFGYARLGGNVQQAMKTGIEFALDKGLIINNDDRFILFKTK